MLPDTTSAADTAPPSQSYAAPRLRHTTAALLGARVVSALATLAILAFLARLRGIDSLGIGSLGVVTGTILASLTEGGTNSLLIREVSRSRSASRSLLTSVLAIRTIILPVFVVISIPLFRLAFGSTGNLVLLFALAFVIQQFGELARALLLATGHPYVTAAHGTLENAVWAAVSVAMLVLGAGLYAVAWAGLLVMVVSAVAGAILAGALGVRTSAASWADLRHAIWLALPFEGYSLVMVAAFRLDTVLVSLLVPAGIAAAGAYFAASRLIASAEYLPEAMSRAIYPHLSRRTIGLDGGAHDVVLPAVRDLLRLSMPVPVCLLIGGSAVLPIIFGPELAPYAWILTVLGLAIPARFLVILYGVALTSANAQGLRVLITAVAVVCGQGLNLIFLPLIGVPAAVAASIVTTVLLLIPYAWEVRHRFGGLFRPEDLLAPLAAALVAAIPAVAVTLVLGNSSILAVGLILVVFGACYFAIVASVPAIQAMWRRRRQPQESRPL